jgi:hypothetical protein
MKHVNAWVAPARQHSLLGWEVLSLAVREASEEGRFDDTRSGKLAGLVCQAMNPDKNHSIEVVPGGSTGAETHGALCGDYEYDEGASAAERSSGSRGNSVAAPWLR